MWTEKKAKIKDKKVLEIFINQKQNYTEIKYVQWFYDFVWNFASHLMIC